MKMASEPTENELPRDHNSDADIQTILGLKNIAVVGISRDPSKPAHFVPKYLKEHGYNIIPVNPSADELLGLRCYKNLLDVPDPIDIVDIFRPAPDVSPVVKAAVKKCAKVVWMQEGIYSKEAAELAKRNGVGAVWNRCMMKEHERLRQGGSVGHG